jgi:hypothetical protein
MPSELRQDLFTQISASAASEAQVAGPPARAGWRRGVAILPLTSTPEYRKMLYRIADQSYQAGIEAKVHGVVSGRTV